MDPIKNELLHYQDLKRRLIETYDLDEDEQVLADTLEGECNLHELLEQAVIQAKLDEETAKATKKLAKDFEARAKRLEHRCQKAKNLVLDTMVKANIPKIANTVTFSTAKSRAKVLITDEDEIPEKFLSVKTSPNKTDIKAALDDGEVVPGACLSNQEPCLRVQV